MLMIFSQSCLFLIFVVSGSVPPPFYTFWVTMLCPSCLIIFYVLLRLFFFFFFSSRRRHTRCLSDWSSDVCSSDLERSELVLLPIASKEPRVVLGRHEGVGATALAFSADGTRLALAFYKKTSSAEIGRASCRERG